MSATVYFHGQPGGAGELALFGPRCADATRDFFVPDRREGAEGEACFRGLAAQVRARFGQERVRLIGFSLGACAVLRVAPHLGEQVERIDLVSPAAPLGTGDLLRDMAGAPVFRTARASPFLFGLMVRAQGLAARAAPGRLYAALFASAQGADVALRDDPAFRAAMLPLLRQALNEGAKGYRREVALYVENWEAELARVTQPVRIWHGKADNWSPVAMADALAARLPMGAPPVLLDGLSHYSTLRHFLRNA